MPVLVDECGVDAAVLQKLVQISQIRKARRSTRLHVNLTGISPASKQEFIQSRLPEGSQMFSTPDLHTAAAAAIHQPSQRQLLVPPMQLQHGLEGQRAEDREVKCCKHVRYELFARRIETANT